MIACYQRSVFLTLFWVLMVVTQGLAQEFTIGAQIRPRGEFRNGFKTLTEEDRDAAIFIEQRSRLFAGFRTEKFRVKMNVQDIRVWGAVDQIFKSDPSLFNVYEAWGEYFFTSKLSVRLGRMPLDYNNARFLGDLDSQLSLRKIDLRFVDLEGNGQHEEDDQQESDVSHGCRRDRWLCFSAVL